MEYRFADTVTLPQNDFKLLAVGELLVDLIAREETGGFAQVENYQRHFGGSPANIAMNVQKLGFDTAIIARIGEDGLGDYLQNELERIGVNIEGIVRDSQNNTSIILVTKSKESPEFLAYRSAERCLTPEDVKSELIGRAGIVHISTFAISAAVSRRAIDKVVRISQDQNRMLSLDPNYRPQLWEGDSPGQEYIRNLLSKVKIVKPSLDDARALFGEASRENYIRSFHEAGCDLVILTLGADGLIVSNQRESRYYPSLAEKVVDTTGAGDAFWSGFYAGLVADRTLHRAVQLGNATAAENLKRVGAMTETPELSRLEQIYNLND